MTAAAAPPGRWHLRWRDYFGPRTRPLLFLGFSSGLPFLLVFSTLSAWLTQAGLSRSSIGYFSWAGLAFSFKFIWSPVVDRLHLPLLGRLGRRRSWMLLAQFAVALALLAMADSDPAGDPLRVALLAVAIAFTAATQDIAIDAYRIESAPPELQGALAAAYQFGYRLALIAAGAGALLLAASGGWPLAYRCMAALMGVGALTTLLLREPQPPAERIATAQEAQVLAFMQRRRHWPAPLRTAGAWLVGAVYCPFSEFISRHGVGAALLMLTFIASFRASDFTMGVMANPFYLDLGFSLKQIAAISKVYGVIMNLLGVALATLLLDRLGTLRTLLIGLLCVCLANGYFSWMAQHPPGVLGLAAAISCDNIAIGIEGTAFVVYLSGLVSLRYTATQYALLGMVWAVPCKFLAGFSGRIVDALGYPLFFIYTALLSLPAILLALQLLRRERRTTALADSAS